MTRKIFFSIFAVAAAILMVSFVAIVATLYPYFHRQLASELAEEASYIATALEGEGISYLHRLSQRQQERVTLIGPDGEVLFDSQSNAQAMENHADREEVLEARQTGEGFGERNSETLGVKTLYYAVLLDDGRVQESLSSILMSALWPVIIIFFVMLGLSVAVSSLVARSIVRPINAIEFQQDPGPAPYPELSPLIEKISLQSETIQRQVEEAKRQQEEFSIITGNMEEGLLTIGPHTELLSYNASALLLLDVQQARNGQSVLELNRSPAFQGVVEAALQGQHKTAMLPSGDTTVQLIANPVWQSGRPAGAMVLLLDVTERTQRETLRREFTANVSHELKTPLTSISGFAEILRDGLVQPADVSRFAGRIYDESQRLTELVRDILKLSQLDEGSLPFPKEPVDLYAVAASVCDRLQDAAEKAGVQLRLSGGEAVIQGVRTVAEEILYNLCDNAVKYNRPGGEVEISVQKDVEGGVTVRVSDTGIGIPLADQGRVFERFYRVDKSHSQEVGGTGLGLSIAKHSAQFLGAALWLDSTPGKGSTFFLRWEAPEDASAEP